MNRLVLSALLSLLVATPLSGCKRQSADDPGEQAATESAAETGARGNDEAPSEATGDEAADDEGATAAADDDASAQGAGYELLEAGAEPRRLLRYDLDNIQRSRAEVRVLSEADLSADGQALPSMTIPEMVMEFTVSDIERLDGDLVRARVASDTMRFEAPENDPQAAQIAQMLNQQMGDISYSGSMNMNSAGQPSDVEFEINGESAMAEQMRSNLYSTLDQLATQLPSEPVGIGARWRVTQSVSEGMPFPITTSAIYTLEESEGTRVVLGVTLEEMETPEVVNDPATGEELPVEIDELSVRGQGQLTTHLDRLLGEGTMELTVTMDMEVTSPTPQRVQGVTRMRTVIRPLD